MTIAQRYIEKSMKRQWKIWSFLWLLSSIWQFVSRTNKYIDETQPWVLAKDENKREKLASVMAHLAESIRQCGIMLKPFLTRSTKKMFAQIGLMKRSIKIVGKPSYNWMYSSRNKSRKRRPNVPSFGNGRRSGVY